MGYDDERWLSFQHEWKILFDFSLEELGRTRRCKGKADDA